ncbi:MAG: carbohydrate ABC transporter substrate-binding protein [Oscillospiraceae bacterium]|nr:carbohydrate ABC transporter substrate-binding protein [Ruminococcus sp.]MBQ7013325.1 carbohydrate ABC transporter substrate-binding protein [Oscillospiraceae bacterium]
MRKMKAALAALLIASMSMVSFGCGGAGGTSSVKDIDSMTREEVASIAAADKRLTGELENKTIKWLSDWDINPGATGKSTPIDLAIFQERYGGEIKWIQCTYAERYDKLANAINSDEGIDFFYAGNFDAFPKGAIRGMFAPIDDYVDFDSELWADVKEANDSVMWNGQHYMAVVQVTGDNCAVIYNRDTISELGFDDPAELFEKGEWTWDVFQEMLAAHVDVPNGKYGIDGWWFESGLSATTGVPYVGLEDGKLVNNLSDPAIERVQNFMYDLYNNDSIAIGVGDYGWSDKPANIGEGNTLFYPCGLWALYGGDVDTTDEDTRPDWKRNFGENCFFVPMPADPDADEHYMPTNMESYMFVTGGHNPEGVAKYLDCKRMTIVNEAAKAIGDEQFVKDYQWTEEMIEMKLTMDEMALDNPVLDFKGGISTDLADMLDSSEYGVRAASRGTPWNESLATIKDAVDTMVNEANNS